MYIKDLRKEREEIRDPRNSNGIKREETYTMYLCPPIGHQRDCIFISGLIPVAIANIVYVVRQRQKARLSAIVKKGIS